MGTIVTRKRYACPVLLSIVLASFAGAASAEDLPSYMAPIGGRTASSAAETATKDVLALNTMMFQLYGASGAIFRNNLMANHPIILGLFSGAGGRFILYRPGQPPLEAPSVPIRYQLMKSVGHSTMALSEVVMPFLDNASDTSWRGSLLAYRSQMQSALDDLNKADVLGEWQENSKLILANNIAFMDDCAKNGVITVAAFQAFANKQAPLLKKNIAWAAQTQIGHWMGVIADWKKMLGSDWDKTYAASNTIYVARQNNMLFSVLAQFFGPDAINSRLVLIETISFTTTPEEMLDALTRIVADRSVGDAFFGSANRTPDLVNENFRQYSLSWGNLRVARLFKDLDVPLTVVLNAEYPRAHPSEWKDIRAVQPDAPIVAHGMDNTSHMLPLSGGLDEQKAYIRDTLNLIAATTGVTSTGWSSPSVYANADTMQAMAAAGITYTLDGMDSDIVSRLNTPDGPVVLLPYPVVTVDMGQSLARLKSPPEIAALWLDYVLELAEEARADASREATTVVIGIHPFVVGTPDGAAAMRRVLMRLKSDPSVWLTDTAAILKTADGK